MNHKLTLAAALISILSFGCGDQTNAKPDSSAKASSAPSAKATTTSTAGATTTAAASASGGGW
jgi:hypothetical protein